MAANEAMQWRGFWWCACGSMSSFVFSGLKSHGVCVELLVTVISSTLAMVPFVTADAVELKINNPQNKENKCVQSKKKKEEKNYWIKAINATNCYANVESNFQRQPKWNTMNRKKNSFKNTSSLRQSDVDSASTVGDNFNIVSTNLHVWFNG